MRNETEKSGRDVAAWAFLDPEGTHTKQKGGLLQRRSSGTAALARSPERDAVMGCVAPKNRAVHVSAKLDW